MPLPANPPRNDHSPLASMRAHHTGIRYPDFEDARSFWVDKLDWRVLQTWPYGDLTLAYVLPPDQDDFHLEILAGPGAVPQTEFADVGESLGVTGFNHVCLEVDDLDRVLAELRARGIEIVDEPFEIEDISARLAFFRDPCGNMFELSQPTPRPDTAPVSPVERSRRPTADHGGGCPNRRPFRRTAPRRADCR